MPSTPHHLLHRASITTPPSLEACSGYGSPTQHPSLYTSTPVINTQKQDPICSQSRRCTFCPPSPLSSLVAVPIASAKSSSLASSSNPDTAATSRFLSSSVLLYHHKFRPRRSA
ncbi:hypothetical protein M0R45_019331 [Rubus argutus]|uniref:Uncharacterized protein n=1 Tax=Rubus argutus TaxID=59490 RepID=A0AAW1X7H5_RUBAR